MLEHLFGSKTRLKLLKLFLGSPEDTFFVREISRKLDMPINAVRRELEHLALAEIIVVSENKEERGKGSGEDKKKFFCLNTKSVLIKELDSLLIKDRFSREQNFILTLKGLLGVEFLLLSGRFVGSKDAPVDILLVGPISPKEVDLFVKKFEKEISEEVRFTLMKTKEFIYRRDVADKFLSDLLSKKNLVLVDRLKVNKNF